MSRKAVDVVLLPEEAMMDKVIEVNAELMEKFGRKIVLNKNDCLQHISLAMGCIDEKDVGDIEQVLKEIAKECPVGDLKVVGVRTAVNAQGEKVSVIEVKKTNELQLLHEQIMKRMTAYFSYDVSEDMIYDEEVAETTLLWIKNYPEKSSFARFSPHITIGYGELGNQSFPKEFAAVKLALCHLGNHCTCRKILVSLAL